jgi:acyl carrier protein
MGIDRVKQFVHEHVVADPTCEVRETDDWLANGLVNSVGIMRIVSFVEREFKTTVPEEDVTVDNFKSLKDIAKYLEQRKLVRAQQQS